MCYFPRIYLKIKDAIKWTWDITIWNTALHKLWNFDINTSANKTLHVPWLIFASRWFSRYLKRQHLHELHAEVNVSVSYVLPDRFSSNSSYRFKFFHLFDWSKVGLDYGAGSFSFSIKSKVPSKAPFKMVRRQRESFATPIPVETLSFQ